MTPSARPEPHITLGQLRQNPTKMVRDVRDGDDYVLTDRGRPVARIIPFTSKGWVSAESAAAAFRHPVDAAWASDLAAYRSASDLRDPFAE